MIADLPRYLVEATLVWTVLLLFYLAVFRRRANWRGQRSYLLAGLLLGTVMPVLPKIRLGGPAAAVRLPAEFIAYVTPSVAEGATTAPAAVPALGYPEIAVIVWISIALLILGLSFYRLARHLRPGAQNGETYAGYRVIRSARVRSPYAALGRIYLPQTLTPELERVALLHESAHLRHGHFRERMLLLLGTSFFWFHPLSWVYARLLSAVHEYEADAAVTREISVKTYGRHLLHATLAPRPVPGLFSSPIKKRIAMLTQPNTNSGFHAAYWPLLIFVIASLFVACSADELNDDLAPVAEARQFSLPELQKDETAPVPINEEFPDFLHAFYSEIRYPAAERNAGKSGTVSVEVRLSRTGRVEGITTSTVGESGTPGNEALVVIGYSDTEVGASLVATADDGLKEEVSRTIRAIGDFRPATEDGSPVPAVLRFDVRFGLE